MRKKNLCLHFIVFFLTALHLCYAQKQEKIKGNKVVTTVHTEVPSFLALDLDEDFEVELMYSNTPFVSIEIDENLHEVIEFKIQDSILLFNNLKRITSKKKLHIKVGYTDALQHIKASNDSKITSVTPLNFKTCKLSLKEDANVALTISAKNFNLECVDKSKARLNLTSDTTTVSMRGTSKLEALINSPKFAFFVDERANAELEGNCDYAEIALDNSTEFNGKNFTVNTCKLKCDFSSKVALEVIKHINLSISGSSTVYLYQNPKIEIEYMTDTAKLQKRVK